MSKIALYPEFNMLYLHALKGKESFAEHLEVCGIDVNYISQTYPQTVLHYATSCRNIKVMEMLLELGANTDMKDAARYTPLHVATIVDDVDAMRLLLEHGAYVHCSSPPFVHSCSTW